MTQETLQEAADIFQAAQIFGYDEETHEGDQQHHIDFLQQTAVGNQQDGDDQNGGHQIGNHTEYGQQAQYEQCGVNQQFLGAGDLFVGQLLFGQHLGQCGISSQYQYDQTDSGQRQSHREEVSCAHVICCVQVQVLRVAYGCCHAAQICCDGLQHDDRDHVATATQLLQQRQGEGNENDQCNVVCDQHGAEEGEEYQSNAEGSSVAYTAEQLIGQCLECTDAFEATDHRHQTQQQTQYTKVDIFDVFHVRRDQKHRAYGAQCGNAEHRFFFNE